METLLYLIKVFINFFLEDCLPGAQTWEFSIKDECISLIPDAPSTYHKNFHEERIRKSSSSVYQLFMNIATLLPCEA